MYRIELWNCSIAVDCFCISLCVKNSDRKYYTGIYRKTFYEYFLDSFHFIRDVFFSLNLHIHFYYAWLDYIVLMAISLVTSIVLEWFKKLIRYEKFIDWVKRLVTKEGVTVH